MAKKAAAEAFVLDGSVSLAWYFKDEADPYADAIAARFPGIQAVVPTLWPFEVANAVLMGERRKRSTEAQAARRLGYLSSLPITIEDETTARVWSEVLGLARSHQISAYDAAYLALALRRGLPLAKIDDKLKAAAAADGIAEYQP
jgi:predicted nucleic acid-binding protein